MTPSFTTKAFASLLLALSLLSVASTYSLLSLILEGKDFRIGLATNAETREYSYVGDDFPPDLPVPLNRKLALVTEESVHYEISPPIAKHEWRYHLPYSYGGIVRLGADNRVLYVSLIHQVHCLQKFRDDLGGRRKLEPDWRHHQHCFNYLRRWILCDADLTLEHGDFRARNFTVERQGAEYVCKDWEGIYDYMTEGWLKWNKYRIAHNITTMELGLGEPGKGGGSH